jgi:hypothetical protein
VKYTYLDTHGVIAAPKVLYVGVPQLHQLAYLHLAEFARRSLEIISAKEEFARTIAMTLHGPGFGLDEREALLAQTAGILQALRAGRISRALEHIFIVEIDPSRCERLRSAISERFADESYATEVKDGTFRLSSTTLLSTTASAEISSLAPSVNDADTKPYVFVAMPFDQTFDDTYHYGIQAAAHSNNLLCERIDAQSFTGDVLAQIKKKIGKAAVLIADLSSSDPNVYLEVGYAWANGCPVVLLTKQIQEMRFDTRGQRCLQYESIKNLETQLTAELSQLSASRLLRF